MCLSSCIFVIHVLFSSGAVARVSGAPWVSKSTHPRKFSNYVIAHRTTVRPHHRHTNVK